MNVRSGFTAIASLFMWPIVGLHAPSASAQSTASDVELEATELDTVEVRGERRRARSGALGERSVLDTPFSITTITATQIEQRQINMLGRAFFADASVFTGGSTYGMWPTSLYVRGLPLELGNSFKIDGLPLYTFGVELPMEMFEQVQLLKGSTGFMYGFGAPGGIVNYITKKPTETKLLSVDAGYRSDSLISEHVDVGGRFGAENRYGYRFNASNEQGDVYYGSRLDREAAAASFDFRLNEDLTLSAELLHQRRRIDQPVPYLRMDRYTSTRLLPVIDGERRLASDVAAADTRSDYGDIGLRWRIGGDWQARLDYAITRTDNFYDQEYLYLTDRAGNFSEYMANGHNINRYEFLQAMLEGSFRTGPIKHQLVMGVSQQRQYGWGSRDNNWALARTGNLYDSIQLVWNETSDRAVYKTADYLQRAIFISDALTFSPRWSLLAGLRYTDYLQRGYNSSGTRTSRYPASPLTPTVALMFKPAADTTIYASYVESLEAGSVVGSNYANADDLLPALESKQAELGAKIEREAWAASAALFRIERGATYTTDDNRFVQDGEIRYQGLELSAQLHPAAGWTVATSALLMDADYQRASAALTGKRPSGFVRRSGTLSLQRVFERVPGLSLHTDVRASGPMRRLPGSALTAPGYLVANAGAGYRFEWRGHHLTLRAEVMNLFDRDYWLGGSNTIQPSEPRTLALNAKIDL